MNRVLRKSVEFEPSDKPKKGKGKGKGKQKKLKTVEEHEDESFYNRSFKQAQRKEIQEKEDNFSFREKLQNREYNKAPIKLGLEQMQPAEEDIFDLLDRASKETRNFGRGKFVSSNKAPALISTKGSFAGIGGSGGFRELGWQSYYEYDEEDMMDYEYQEAEQDKDMDLLTFRERLQKRSGVAIHNGIEVSPAANDARNYLESPVPVANRSLETEEKIKNKMLKNKAGRYYDDGIDMVSPVDLVEEALDRGFRSRDKSGDEQDSDDEISREKREAARKHYGIRRSPSDDDVARTKEQIKADAKSEKSGKSRHSPGEKALRSSRASQGSRTKDSKQEKAPSSCSQEADRKKAGFDHRTEPSSHQDRDSQPARYGKSSQREDRKKAGFAHGIESSGHQEHDSQPARYGKSSPREDRKTKKAGFDHRTESSGHQERDFQAAHDGRSSTRDTKSKKSSVRPSPAMSEESVEADLNWNLDRSHVKTTKSKNTASAMFERSQDQDEEESPFLPPITPKSKPKPKSKSCVISKEIATQITADALIPQQPVGDYWVNKDTILNRSDPYADVALRMPTGLSQRSFYEQEERPATYRSTFTAYEPPSESYEKPKFEMLSDPEDDERPDVYTRLSDAKAYQQTNGQAVDVWAQKNRYLVHRTIVFEEKPWNKLEESWPISWYLQREA